MKKFFIAIIAVVSIGLGYAYTRAGNVQDFVLGGNSGTPTKVICAGTATTTPEYLNTTSATSTCQLFVANMDEVDANWSAKASTTSEIWYETYFSNDDGASKNWYPSRTYSVSDGSITYSGEPQTTKIPIESAATTTVNTIIQDIEAKYMQVRYLPHTGNAGIYMELVGRNKN